MQTLLPRMWIFDAVIAMYVLSRCSPSPPGSPSSSLPLNHVEEMMSSDSSSTSSFSPLSGEGASAGALGGFWDIQSQSQRSQSVRWPP